MTASHITCYVAQQSDVTQCVCHACAHMCACTICTYLEGCCLRCCFHAVSACCFHQLLQLLQVQRLTQPLRVICSTTATATFLRQPTDVNSTTQRLQHTSGIKTCDLACQQHTVIHADAGTTAASLQAVTKILSMHSIPGDIVGTWRPQVTLFV
jgi:hypothetical protein